jgi:GntR family transcriptional repressor for pyruvate dehydrogenase complex
MRGVGRASAPEPSTATARAVFASVGEGSRVDAVARRLGEAIRVGLLEDGSRLPNETTLASQLGVAPATLRDSLALLRRGGLVETRRGRGGGTFVRAPAEQSASQLTAALRSLSPQTIRDLADHRVAISGAAARLAAQRALEGNLRQLQDHHRRLLTAGTRGERRRADARFHLEVAAASQSVRLTRAEAALWAEVADLVWLPLSDADLHMVVEEHAGILRAIEDHDDRCARRRAEEHVRAEMHRLLELRLTGTAGT